MNSSLKTVRVFISSTFRDMHAERDHLIQDQHRKRLVVTHEASTAAEPRRPTRRSTARVKSAARRST